MPTHDKGGIERKIPIFTWLPSYERAWLRTDLMAGLAVWAMTVPQALAYAGIAGVPPVHALYAAPLAMAAYAVFGSSRTMCVGPESAISLISAATVGALAADDVTEFVALTSLLALIAGALFLLFGLLRLGWVANFLAQPVLQGFIQGIALTVIAGQASLVFGTETKVAETVAELRNLPQLVGFDVDYTGFLLQSWAVLTTLGNANGTTAAVGIASLALLFAFRRFRPFAPSALITVVVAVAAVSLLGLEARGVSVIGRVPTGMFPLSLPGLNVTSVMALLPGAFAIVLLGYSVSLGVAAVGAQSTGETIDPDQELVGLGVANLGAAISSGFVVCGSLSRASVILRAGGRTQLVCLINAALVVLTLLFLMPLFYRLPQATLAAIVIVAMSGLLNLGYFRELYHISRGEFAYGMAAFVGVLGLGILQGVALGVVLALVVLIRRVSHPETAVLGRLPGTTAYRDIRVHAEAETIAGLLIFRFDAPIIFTNVGFLSGEIRRFIGEAPEPIRLVVIAAQQINDLDSTGEDQLRKLGAELEGKGIQLAFAEVKHRLREPLQRMGADFHFESIEDAVQEFSQGL